MSCDLNLFTKCLSLRLKRVLPDIIHADQTCGIPVRHIYDSIALSRDIIDYAKGDDIPMSIINIDQEKALDRVSHEYLFRVLKVFGLGDRFISYIKLCYIDVSSFININGSVCGPVPLSRGIKQGDSISSQLYIMSIEPLLIRLRNEPLFKGITLPLYGTIKLTAYADDVNLYVTQSSDINIINSILSTYLSVCNAKVNWNKSCGLKINGWDVGLNCKLGISWNTKEQSF